MNNIDKAVGARIRLYRKALGMSQTDLANRVGVRFQQIQKYENGSNRVAASRLWRIADALGVPIIALFEDVRQQAAEPAEAAGDTSEMLGLYLTLPEAQRPKALAYLRDLAAPLPEPSG